MNRKWRTNYGAYDTAQAYPAFRAAIPRGEAGPGGALADPTDLYAVYTVLHIEGKSPQLRWSPQGRFHYFVAVQQVGGGAPAPAAEGDEDPPEVRAWGVGGEAGRCVFVCVQRGRRHELRRARAPARVPTAACAPPHPPSPPLTGCARG